MKIHDVYFLKSCAKVSDFPRYVYPEFAFAGRSNVGKSSLINMLMKKKGLVKTGSRPGVTKTINFFILNKGISVADLPGFGYAEVPLQLKKTFLPLIRNYIRARENLKLVFLLIDIRRIPDRFELDLLSLLAAQRIPAAITLTKCDKLSRSQGRRNVRIISESLGISHDALFATSAKSGYGRKELLDLMDEYAAVPRPPDG
ncbi:MAG: ribosome biogenesis GTP-binding protein YsxC [Spirochaetes bacterium RBG_13_51_14]|nr:MAG: ribosome biogenesis GTP-binding protein YsxC [Spirochaetes bacterium RBG_13_51_14]